MQLMYRLLLMTALLGLPWTGALAAYDFNAMQRDARLADAAYMTEAEAGRQLESLDMELVHYANLPVAQVVYLLARAPATGQQFISVRGTSNIENAIVDVSFKLQPDARAKVALHQGFAQAADGIYRDLLPFLDKQRPISTTGHSLGGAIAVILAMYLDVDGYPLGPVTTFGQPKVTNVAGARTFEHLDVRRVVTAGDLVPLLPPVDVMDLSRVDIYWHLGKEIVLLDGGDYAELQGLASMMRATRVVNATLGPQNLDMHMMTHYLDHLRSRIKAARLVPYDTSVDLLQWFRQ